MPKATIQSKTGAFITIEGTKEELAKIISDFEKMSVIQNVKTEIYKKNVKKKDKNKRSAASHLVIELKDEGYFNKPKMLGEIADALEDKGYIYPITTLSGIVLGLVKKKILGRKKINGKWVYGK